MYIPGQSPLISLRENSQVFSDLSHINLQTNIQEKIPKVNMITPEKELQYRMAFPITNSPPHYFPQVIESHFVHVFSHYAFQSQPALCLVPGVKCYMASGQSLSFTNHYY